MPPRLADRHTRKESRVFLLIVAAVLAVTDVGVLLKAVFLS
jgi:hypothetical protein